jgi:putative inorganic carbon (HCO3(-)) transporter
VALLGLAIAIALLPVTQAGTVVVGLAVLLVALIRPQIVVLLIPFAVPFGSLRRFSAGPFEFGLLEILLLAAISMWLLHAIALRRIEIQRLPLLMPLLVLSCALLLSAVFAPSLELSAKELVKWLEVALVLVLVGRLSPPGWAEWMAVSVLLAGAAEAVYGIYQFLFRVGPEGFILYGRFMRAYGHFAQPNPFGGYLGLVAPLALALALRAVARLLAHSGEQYWARGLSVGLVLDVLSVCSFALIAAALLMSWSRGAWLGFAVSCAVVLALHARGMRLGAAPLILLALLALGLLAVQSLPASLLERISGLLPYVSNVDLTAVQVTDANWAVLERMAHWQAALAMWSDHLWVGVGIGNYPVLYPQYAVGRWLDPLGHAHNYYLNIAAEAGLIGLAAYLGFFLSAFSLALRTTGTMRYRSSELQECRIDPGFWRALAVGAEGTLTHLCVHNLFDNLFVHNMTAQLGLSLGLVCLAWRLVRAHRD